MFVTSISKSTNKAISCCMFSVIHDYLSSYAISASEKYVPIKQLDANFNKGDYLMVEHNYKFTTLPLLPIILSIYSVADQNLLNTYYNQNWILELKFSISISKSVCWEMFYFSSPRHFLSMQNSNVLYWELILLTLIFWTG